MTSNAQPRSFVQAIASKSLIPIALSMLIGANSCPLMEDDSSDDGNGGSGSGSASASVDIDGVWNLTFDTQATVVLRTAQGQMDSVTLRPGDGPLTLLTRTIDLTTFCWRSDVVCPEQVLPPQTTMVQSAAALLLAYNRKGPLAELTNQGLPGTLSGAQLSVPLGMVPLKSNPCTLTQGSVIYATASTPSADVKAADALQGQVTLRYGGSCVTIGGNGALYDTDVLELSVRFTATRN